MCIDGYNINVETTPPAIKRAAGRPRAFDRDAALDRALELFWRHGFEGTSTAQLIEAMGISPPSLYAAFGSKEALHREAVALYLRRHGGFLAAPLAEPGPARVAIERVLFSAARQFAQSEHPPGCMVSCAELQGSPAGAVAAATMTELRHAAQQAIRVRLDAARASGELTKESDTATLAAYFASVIQGMAVQARDGARAPQLKRLAAVAMRAWPNADQ